jgi:hypothetical protein
MHPKSSEHLTESWDSYSAHSSEYIPYSGNLSILIQELHNGKVTVNCSIWHSPSYGITLPFEDVLCAVFCPSYYRYKMT